jgi:hypothetical protein
MRAWEIRVISLYNDMEFLEGFRDFVADPPEHQWHIGDPRVEEPGPGEYQYSSVPISERPPHLRKARSTWTTKFVIEDLEYIFEAKPTIISGENFGEEVHVGDRRMEKWQIVFYPAKYAQSPGHDPGWVEKSRKRFQRTKTHSAIKVIKTVISLIDEFAKLNPDAEIIWFQAQDDPELSNFYDKIIKIVYPKFKSRYVKIKMPYQFSKKYEDDKSVYFLRKDIYEDFYKSWLEKEAAKKPPGWIKTGIETGKFIAVLFLVLSGELTKSAWRKLTRKKPDP